MVSWKLDLCNRESALSDIVSINSIKTGYACFNNGKVPPKTARKSEQPHDFVCLDKCREELSLIPAGRFDPSRQVSESPLVNVVESDSYLNAMDATLPMLPPVMQAVAGARDPDPAFTRLVANTDPQTEFLGDPSRSVDPEGDAHLIRRLDTVPVKLTQALWQVVKDKISGKGFNSPGAVTKPIAIGREKPIKVDALLNKMVKIIQDHPHITPTLGEEHKWSPQAKKYNRWGFLHRLGAFITGKQGPPAPLLGRSKLFLSLACGWTRTYLPTGKEDQLENHLMKFDDRSVKLEDVLGESYRLNEGNLYKTLLTAENVLAKDVYCPDRDQQPLQKKLEYLRNDSEPEGDNFGAWYHFMGASLYGLMRSAPVAKAVVLTEAAGSFFLEGPDRQETHINVAGADFGSGLRKIIRDEAWKKPLPAGADTAYMNLNEFPRQA